MLLPARIRAPRGGRPAAGLCLLTEEEDEQLETSETRRHAVCCSVVVITLIGAELQLLSLSLCPRPLLDVIAASLGLLSSRSVKMTNHLSGLSDVHTFKDASCFIFFPHFYSVYKDLNILKVKYVSNRLDAYPISLMSIMELIKYYKIIEVSSSRVL